MSRLILTLLLTSAASMRFEDYVVAFNKKYSFGELMIRRAHYEQSLQRVAAHNAGGHSWLAGINQFSDLSDEEFKNSYLMRPQKCSATNTVGVPGETTHLRGASDNKKKAADLPADRVAMVGDRLFTDVLCGNRLGLYTVLVRPVRLDGTACYQDRVQRFERTLARWMGAPTA